MAETAEQRRSAALEEALRDIAGTVVMIADSGNVDYVRLACTETSPLVGRCRSILAMLAGAQPHNAEEAAFAAAIRPAQPTEAPDGR